MQHKMPHNPMSVFKTIDSKKGTQAKSTIAFQGGHLSFQARRGYLVYLVDGDVPFFRVSFSPIFSRTGYQSKDVYLEQNFFRRCKIPSQA